MPASPAKTWTDCVAKVLRLKRASRTAQEGRPVQFPLNLNKLRNLRPTRSRDLPELFKPFAAA